MEALLQFSKMYESTVWGDAFDSRSSYGENNTTTMMTNNENTGTEQRTTSISTSRGMHNLTDFDFQQIADNSRDGFNFAIKVSRYEKIQR